MAGGRPGRLRPSLMGGMEPPAGGSGLEKIQRDALGQPRSRIRRPHPSLPPIMPRRDTFRAPSWPSSYEAAESSTGTCGPQPRMERVSLAHEYVRQGAGEGRRPQAGLQRTLVAAVMVSQLAYPEDGAHPLSGASSRIAGGAQRAGAASGPFDITSLPAQVPDKHPDPEKEDDQQGQGQGRRLAMNSVAQQKIHGAQYRYHEDAEGQPLRSIFHSHFLEVRWQRRCG